MVQQLTNLRIDKHLTMSDLRRITYASCLNFFHTNTMFQPFSLGLYYDIDYYYIKRKNINTYSFQDYYTGTYGSDLPRANYQYRSEMEKTLAEIKEIHPDLECDKDGDERLCVYVAYKKAYNTTIVKQKLGFFLMIPQSKYKKDKYGVVTEYKLIIVPKPGLFPAKNE